VKRRVWNIVIPCIAAAQFLAAVVLVLYLFFPQLFAGNEPDESTKLVFINQYISDDITIEAKYDSIELICSQLAGEVTFEASGKSIGISVDQFSRIETLRVTRPVLLDCSGTLEKIILQDTLMSSKASRVGLLINKTGQRLTNITAEKEFGTGTAGGYLGLFEFEGDTYYADADGKLCKGVVEDNGKRWYFDEEYHKQSGFIEIEGNKYYFSPDGNILAGPCEIDGNIYLMGIDGSVSKGYVSYNDKQYWCDDEGIMRTGLITDGGETRYLTQNGTYAVGLTEIGGKVYYFGQDGLMQEGVTEIDEELYYFYPTGGVAANQYLSNGYKAGADMTLVYAFMDNEELDEKVGAILDSLELEGKTEREKLHTVFEWIRANIKYRYVNVDVNAVYDEDFIAELALYAVINRRCSCELVAALSYVMVKRLGYRVEYIVGRRVKYTEANPETGEPGKAEDLGRHMWIRVFFEGKWLYFDAMYTTAVMSDPDSMFLFDDAAAVKTHRWDGHSIERELGVLNENGILIPAPNPEAYIIIETESIDTAEFSGGY